MTMKIEIVGSDNRWVEISEQELLEKFWSNDAGAPIALMLTRQVGPDVIAAQVDFAPEEKDYCPDILLTSYNEVFNKSSTWFALEAPNADSNVVVGHLYAGDDRTETDDWIARISDGVRPDGDDSRRVVLVDTELASFESVNRDMRCFSENKNAVTENQLSLTHKFSYEKFGKTLAKNPGSKIEFIDGEIVSKDEAAINYVADLLDSLEFTAVTGYYDPKDNVVDTMTGYYYVNI